jgi:hypothetical protein
VIGDGQKVIDWLASRMRPDEETAKTNGGAWSAPSPHSDEAVVEKCRAAGNAAKFEDLFYRGLTFPYGDDDSRADLALLSMLAFWTQDPVQLERLFSASALGQRDKWRRRSDYRQRTIRKALDGLGETYKWPREREVAQVARPYIGKATKATLDEPTQKLSLVRFTEREDPPPREFIVPDLLPRYHPTTLYGWGGTAKSLIALLLSMSVAGRTEKFFGRDVAVHGQALYIDFELDADEQHRRVVQLAEGMKMEVPEDLLYLSTLGVRTHEAIEYALSVCEEHDVVLVVLDSLGPAMIGDMAAAKDVIEFHNCYIAPFKEVGVTPILVDHQARQQAGEGYQAKGAFGSAYKEHLSRSLIQVERGDQGAQDGTLNIRLRHKKANFGALVEPFDVSLSFSDEMICAQTRELTPSDRAQEITLNSKDRVRAALEDGPAYPDELVETTGLTRSTVKNAITALKKAGVALITGETRNQMEQVALVARPIKEKATRATPKEPPLLVSDDHIDPSTVAGFFANPPSWLPTQLAKYRENPELHLKPLCSAVAAELLGDGLWWEEVAEEVKRELEKKGVGG